MLLVVVVVVQARWTCCDSSNPNSTYCFNTAYCDGCNRPSEPFAKFATFEVSTTDEERVLDGGERVLDVLASWQHSFDEDKVKNKKGGREVETFRYMFKVRLFLEPDPADTRSVDLFYMQAVHDVVDSRYPCAEADAITLAALRLQEKHGDCGAGGQSFLEGKLDMYMPAKFCGGNTAARVDNISKVWARLAGKYTAKEAKKNYLEFIKQWRLYGSSYFIVEPQNSPDLPKKVVVAINAKGILVVDATAKEKELIAEYPYSEVVTWGQSSKSFVLVTGNLIRQQKIYFKSEQGKEMNNLVHEYVNKIIHN